MAESSEFFWGLRLIWKWKPRGGEGITRGQGAIYNGFTEA